MPSLRGLKIQGRLSTFHSCSIARLKPKPAAKQGPIFQHTLRAFQQEPRHLLQFGCPDEVHPCSAHEKASKDQPHAEDPHGSGCADGCPVISERRATSYSPCRNKAVLALKMYAESMQAWFCLEACPLAHRLLTGKYVCEEYPEPIWWANRTNTALK